jgi:hypothetical protein
MVTQGAAPYWRVALTRGWGDNSLMVGTYGMYARLFPGGGQPLSGATDRYTDIAGDLQYVRTMGSDGLTLAGTWIHERRSLDATAPADTTQTLDVVRARATFRRGQRWGFSVAPFLMKGSADAAFYPDSRTGSPNSSGVIGEIDFNPWQNVRLGLQYTAYSKFDGSNASANSTLYLFAWLLY